MMEKRKALTDYFETEANDFSGHFGLAAQRVDEATPLLYHADDIFPTASVIKLAVVAEYLTQVANGELEPDRQIRIWSPDQVGGSGILKDLRPGTSMKLCDYVMLAITVSDNTAANVVIKHIGGVERVNARLRALGMHNTTMDRPFVFNTTADNTGTPADFLRLLLTVARHQFMSPAISQQFLDIMRRQQYMHYIPRYLPYHPFAAEYGYPQEITIANKVGMLPGIVNDAAVITTPSFTYALVIFTRDCQDTQPDPDNEGALLVARLSKRICDHFVDRRKTEDRKT